MRSRVGPADRPLPLGFDWPNKKVPVVFINVSPSNPISSSPFSSSSSSSSSSFFPPSSSSSSSSFSSSFSFAASTSKSSQYSSSATTNDNIKNDINDDSNNNNNTNDKARNNINKQLFQYENSNSANTSSSFSYSNLAEAEVLCGVVQGLLDQGVTLNEVIHSFILIILFINRC